MSAHFKANKWFYIILLLILLFVKVDRNGYRQPALVVVGKAIVEVVCDVFDAVSSAIKGIPAAFDETPVSASAVTATTPGVPAPYRASTPAPAPTHSTASPQVSLERFIAERHPAVADVTSQLGDPHDSSVRVTVRWMVNGVTKNRLYAGGDIDPAQAVPLPDGKRWERIARPDIHDPSGQDQFSFFVRE